MASADEDNDGTRPAWMKQEYTRENPSLISVVPGSRSFMAPLSFKIEATVLATRAKDALSLPGEKNA
jgi:hypoxanthine-guanine phosphoribosyltransferase